MAGVGGGSAAGAAGLSVWQQRALAMFSLGVALAKQCRLARVAEVVPGEAEVPSTTRRFERLLADRGLAWPALLDQCRRRGWSFLCRVQGQTRVRTADGHVGAIGEVAPRPGTRWQGTGCAFLDAGWRDVAVVAVWPRDHDQPWLLVADLDPT